MTGRPAIPFAGCFRATDGDEPKVGDGELAFIGLPDDSRSSYRHGSASGPNRIRLAYDGLSFNACTETGIDLTERVTDLGNWRPVDEWEETAAGWRDRTRELLRAGAIPFFAGGDHGVTVPIAEALDALGKPVHVVWIDAHGDLYPEFEGSRSSHACTGARMLEMPHIASMTQYGIRTIAPAQHATIEAHKDRLRIHEARHLGIDPLPLPEGIGDDDLVYVTLDLDGFDPAHAPGVSHPVPGGLLPRQVIDLLHRLPGRLVAMDAVEVNPVVDVGDRTAILAARLMHEAMGLAVG